MIENIDLYAGKYYFEKREKLSDEIAGTMVTSHTSGDG